VFPAEGARGLQVEAVMDWWGGGLLDRTGGGQKPEVSRWLSTGGCRISTGMWQCLINVSKVMSKGPEKVIRGGVNESQLKFLTGT
jgi:hypothetical protein